MASPPDFQSLREGVQNALIATVKTVNRLAVEDLDFQKTANPATAARLESSVSRILGLSQKVLKAEAKVVGTQAPHIQDTEDLDLNWTQIVDIIDCIFEKADSALDECTGFAKRRDAGLAESSNNKRSTPLQANLRNANVRKPQLKFEHQTNNHVQTVWKPILTKKPHAIVPLDQSIALADYNGHMEYRHPYETEILKSAFPERAFQQADPIPYKPLEHTRATWVSTYEEVLEMLAELKKANEIAIDLEHHDYRTYVGITCLMQISTRTQDWIVDTLQPWRHKLEVLNEIFADPKIIKVLHGAHMDVQWLQRDLGLYLNGYFDTYYACEVLSYPQRSLAYLLKKFVNFDADKKYQLADWRRRPIPNEMLFYAQSDTHFLLYIYDMMRNELVQHSDDSRADMNLMAEVVRKSKERALTRYDQLTFDPETGDGTRGWLGPILKQVRPMDGPQFAVYRALWQWRDQKARDEDESPQYVMSNQVLHDIARDLPDERSTLEALIPRHANLVRECICELWELVKKSTLDGSTGPSLLQFINSSDRKLTIKAHLPLSEDTEMKNDSSLMGDDISASRLNVSQLFGGMLLSSAWEVPKSSALISSADNDYIQLPWQRRHPDMLSVLSERSQAALLAEQEKIRAKEREAVEMIRVESTPVKLKEEEFTLKAGIKRKAPEPESAGSSHPSSTENNATGNASSGSDESKEDDEMDDDEAKRQEVITRKRAKKAARKAAKKEKIKKLRSNSSGDIIDEDHVESVEGVEGKEEGEEDEEEEAFDYDTARSVMYGSVDKAVEAHKKAFNPYAKAALDRPIKGARRAPPMKGGRSATFRK